MTMSVLKGQLSSKNLELVVRTIKEIYKKKRKDDHRTEPRRGIIVKTDSVLIFGRTYEDVNIGDKSTVFMRP